MSWYEITVLFLTGLFAGFVNTLAGGGSIVSFSILLMFGLPPSIANGTNRINVLTQTFIASSSFKFQKVLDTKKALWLGVP
ncbi:MAG TPA: TSUP family transporter, partial [Bacteroidales bacterium]|nr:TSUP family transporter [Bacteroidales bacterium]